MKYCENCGTKIEKDGLYCPKCGKKDKTKEVKEQKQIENNDNKKEGLGTASMIIGIISLVLSFIINIIILPLALVGLILGVVNKAQNGKKISGIILNGVAMIVAVLVFIALMAFFTVRISSEMNNNRNKYSEYIPSEIEEERLIGRWSCKKTEKILDKDYELSVVINDNDTFSIYDNKDSKNYIEGIYEYENDAFGTIIETKRVYTLELTGEKEYINGKYEGESTNKYEMIVTQVKGKLHAVLNDDNHELNYYCTK